MIVEIGTTANPEYIEVWLRVGCSQKMLLEWETSAAMLFVSGLIRNNARVLNDATTVLVELGRAVKTAELAGPDCGVNVDEILRRRQEANDRCAAIIGRQKRLSRIATMLTRPSF